MAQLVERRVWDAEVDGPNPSTPTGVLIRFFFMKKVLLLKQLKLVIQEEKAKGNKIGLITGCFDIVHPGHIGLFRFAKKHCDVLIIGLENDETIRVSKGKQRPIFKLEERLNFLTELSSIDYLFPIEFTTKFASSGAHEPYQKILDLLKPDYLITNPNYDRYWEVKKKMIEASGGKIILDNNKIDISTSKIADLVIKNFS